MKHKKQVFVKMQRIGTLHTLREMQNGAVTMENRMLPLYIWMNLENMQNKISQLLKNFL